MVLVTGCGRSGTTMLWQLIKANYLPINEVVALNEPRLLYLQKSRHFDMWSKLSKGRIQDFDQEQLCEEYLNTVSEVIDNQSVVYLEKMPEHSLRKNFLSSLHKALKDNLTVINITRCWVDVSSSISEFCC